MNEEKIYPSQPESGDVSNRHGEGDNMQTVSNLQSTEMPIAAEQSPQTISEVRPSDALRRHDDRTVETSVSENPAHTVRAASPDGAKTERGGGLEYTDYSKQNGNIDTSSPSPTDAVTDGGGSTKIFTVTLAETRIRLASAQLFRSERTLQRYCDKGILNCNKAPTAQGQEWLVTDESIEQFINNTPIDTVKVPLSDQPIVTTPGDASKSPVEETPQNKAGSTSDAIPSSGTDKEILLERMVGMQQKEIDHLRVSHISLTERIHESNVIAQNLQTTILKITGHGDPLQIHKYDENSTDADTQSAG